MQIDPYGVAGSVHYLGGLNRLSTILPSFDFETYSEAGYVFNYELLKWQSITKSPPHGLGAVGAPVYSEHPSTEILCLAYDLKNGLGERLWLPSMAPPPDLCQHVLKGGLLEAFNVTFEWYIWINVAVKRYGFPMIHPSQLRCAQASALAFSLPNSLEKTAMVVAPHCPKITDGKRLIGLFSKPRNPLKKEQLIMREAQAAPPRTHPDHRPEDASLLYTYCIGDIQTQSEVSVRCPDLSAYEAEIFRVQQVINHRGMALDHKALVGAKNVIDVCKRQYNEELSKLTDGYVTEGTQVAAMRDWLFTGHGVSTQSLDQEAVETLLKQELPSEARRVIELRQLLSNTSLGKVDAMSRRMCADGRIRDMVQYHKAHTGRFAGHGPQPHNMYTGGPEVTQCDAPTGCGRWFGTGFIDCPWCGTPDWATTPHKWDHDVMDFCLKILAECPVDTLHRVFCDPLKIVQACMRGFFVAAPGHELISADYSAIEAVVLACLAGEDWRIKIFETDTNIYLASMSQTTGIPVEEYLEYAQKNKAHHPDRQKGKVKELALGYGGWVNAMLQFGAADYYASDREIERDVRAWRQTNQQIVKFWYKAEDSFREAIQYPGQLIRYRDISFILDGTVLHVQLPSGRYLHYHKPQITPGERFDRPVLNLSYEGWNSDYTRGPVGWMRISTYGGKLVENIVQAVARDILCGAIIRLEQANYPIVLHVHDEPISEVPIGFGSVAEYEAIMAIRDPWYSDWPIKVGAGWRGPRFRK